MKLPLALPSKFLAPAVESLVGSVLNLVPNRNRYTFQEMEECISNPMVAAVLDVRIHLTVAALGGYQHDRPEIVDDVNRSISMLDGVWESKLAAMLKAIPYGHSFTEKRYEYFKAGAKLAGLQTLNPVRYRFEGGSTGLMHVVYDSIERNRQVKIPFTSGVHIAYQQHLLLDSSSPLGFPALQRIRPLYECYQILLAAIILAAQRQATPILIQKTNLASMLPVLDSSGRPLLNSDGEPILISAGENAKTQLEKLENGSVAVIDRLDEIQAISQASDGKLLMQAIDLVLGLMALCLLVPRSQLLTNVGGVGDASLAESQAEIMRQIVEYDVKVLGSTLVEQVFRPMLAWNHGDLDSYGAFAIIEPKLTNAAQMITAISNALSQGAIAGFEAESAQRIRELSGI